MEMPAAARTAGGKARRLPRSFWIGALATGAMALLYAAVVGGVSGSVNHLAEQVRTDWYLLLPIVAGFGVQVGLLAELRHRHRMGGAAASASAAGAGASTVGMVACCAHHVADLVPFVGATAAATFLYDYRLVFMLVGLGVNAIAISIATRRLRAASRRSHGETEGACALG